MSVQVTVTISEELYQRAERLAQLQQREIAEILVEAIRLPADEENVPPSDGSAETEDEEPP